MGADRVICVGRVSRVDPVAEIMRFTGSGSVDVGIKVLGVDATNLVIPPGAFAAALSDHKIVTTLCPAC